MLNEPAPNSGLSGKEAKYQQRYGEMLDAAALVFSEQCANAHSNQRENGRVRLD